MRAAMTPATAAYISTLPSRHVCFVTGIERIELIKKAKTDVENYYQNKKLPVLAQSLLETKRKIQCNIKIS